MKWWRKKNKRKFISTIEQQRAEKLAELGDLLRRHRQEQALALDEVAAKTRIQQRLLQAIEEGKLDELPEPVYTQSFIKQYADALGLNGAELSSTFPIGYSRLLHKPTWKSLSAAQLRPIHLYLLYIFVIICAVNALSQMLSRSDLQANSSQPQEKPLVSSTSKRDRVSPKQSEKLKSVSATPRATTEIDKPVRIDVSLKAESWIRVVADGKTQFEGVLPKGTQRSWVAQEELTVRAGNAGGVLVTFNQKQAKQMGDPGQVQELTFGTNQRSQ